MNLLERASNVVVAAEVKIIRRVRTAAGARRYGLPIGSIIVADRIPVSMASSGLIDVHESRSGAPRIKKAEIPKEPGSSEPTLPGYNNLYGEDSDYEGFDMVSDHEFRNYYVGRDGEGGWGVWDAKDNWVAGGKTKADALDDLEDFVEPTIPPNCHIGTQEERAKFRVPPPYRFSVFLDEPYATENGKAGLWVGKSFQKTRTGRKWQHSYMQEYRSTRAEQTKFGTLERLQKDVKKLDAYLRKHGGTGDDNTDALMMMRVLGMRPDRGEASGQVETFGATSLLGKHVKVTPGGQVSLTFTPGKRKEPVTIKVKDKMLADMLRTRLSNPDHQRNNPLFPTATADGTLALLRKVTKSDEYKNKDLRTLKANAIALAAVSRYKSVPQTKTEFRRWRKEVATEVADILGNTPQMSLSMYINPSVFADWLGDPSWA